jgi:hypothetical protein
MPPLPSPTLLATSVQALWESLPVFELCPEFVSLRLWPRTWELGLDDVEGYGRVAVPLATDGLDALQVARQLLNAAREGELANGCYEPAEERHRWIVHRVMVSERCRTMVKRDRRRR